MEGNLATVSFSDWIRDRVPLNWIPATRFTKEAIPDQLGRWWWWCLGGTPVFLFLVMVATGGLMSFYYVPQPQHAYESVRRITEEIPFGWYIRSLHKWSANFLIVTMLLHLIRVFFTGAYRKPRELTWIAGCGLLLAVFSSAFTGYSLIYEQLSYWGSTVAGHLTEGIPLFGGMLARLVRGGDVVGANTLTRFFVAHTGIFPVLITLLIVLHFLLVRVHGVAPLQSEKESEMKTSPAFPNHVLTQLLADVFVIYVLTCLACVFPVHMGPPADPLVTPEHVKPEWYFYSVFLWLKLTGLTFSVLTLGGAVLVLVFWPFIDARIRERNPKSEIGVYVGILGVLFFVSLTVWEAVFGR